MAKTVTDLGCVVTIIGRRSGSCCENDQVPFRTVRFRMIFHKGLLFYKFFNIRLFFYLLFHNYDILVANDLDTLLPNFFISRLKRKPLVYDSHEYFTGVPEIQKRPVVKWVWKTIEKMIFPHLDHVITVSDSIAQQYELEYGIRPVVVRNCSRSSEGVAGFSKAETGLNPEDFLLIMQGGGINVDRGGEELIEALSLVENVSLIIAGSGDVLPELRKKVTDLKLSGRVNFVPKLPWHELMRFTRAADAGLSLDKDTNLNYRFSLPNKLFDYISAGIPVIAGNLQEVSAVINKYDCGLIIPEITPSAIADAINKLRNNRELLNKLKQNAVNAAGELTWEKESHKVREFYEKVMKTKLI